MERDKEKGTLGEELKGEIDMTTDSKRRPTDLCRGPGRRHQETEGTGHPGSHGPEERIRNRHEVL